MNKFTKEVAKKIRQARLDTGLTQLELGEKIGNYSATKINLLEAGQRYIKICDLKVISDVLCRDLLWFLGEEFDNCRLSNALWGEKDISNNDKKMISRVIELASKN